jgi:3-dehydroquinate synthetase
MPVDPEKMATAMSRDKKRKRDSMQLILLEGIGKAVIREIPLIDLKNLLNDLR